MIQMVEMKILWCEHCNNVRLDMDKCNICNKQLEKIGWIEDGN